MSSKPTTDNGKVSRVRPIQRSAATRPLPLGPSGTRATMATESRQKQFVSEQSQQIRELELQVATLQKKNIDLQREMHEALGLQQIKAKAVEALNKDLHTKTALEQRVNEFLSTVSTGSLDEVAEELMVLRKKCSRSEVYFAELNERYRDAELRNKTLSETVAETKAELAIHPDKGQAKNRDKCEEFKTLVKRNAELEQKCTREMLAEFKERLVKLEIEKRDLKAENTQQKAKVTTFQREKKKLQEKLATVELDANQKLKEMKDAQIRHLEMLSKLRRSHTKLDAKYKHLLKERAQWQSFFRTANGELSRSTESLASISSVASSSVSRTSFFRDSSNLEEYNVYLESELVAVQESLKIADKEKDRLDRKLKALSDQVVEDENLIAELDLNRSQLVDERDSLAQRCATLDEKSSTLQKSVDELREQLDTILFENNELSIMIKAAASDERHKPQLCPDEGSPQSMTLVEFQTKFGENVQRLFRDQVLTRLDQQFEQKLCRLDARITGVHTAYDTFRSALTRKADECQQLQLLNADYERQIDMLKNNAESLAKHLSAEVRERSQSEMMKLQDQVDEERDAKLKDYEKMQKVLKKALIENEKLKHNEDLIKAKIAASEDRIVQLENQLKSEQQLVTESNGRLTDRLRRAEKENDRLQDEFSELEKQVSELASSRDALEATKYERDLSKARIDTLELQLSAAQQTQQQVKEENEFRTEAKALKMTLAQKVAQITCLIQDLDRERSEKANLTAALSTIRDKCQRDSDEKDSKMADLADDMKKANFELNNVLRDKAHRIEELESQVENLEQIRQLHFARCQEEISTVDRRCIESATKSLSSFAASIDVAVQPGLEFDEFVAQLTSNVQLKWISIENELKCKQQLLDSIKLEQEQSGVSFSQTIEQLKEQLEKDDQSLKRYEEILASQAECIEKIQFERQQLEDGMSELRARDNETIETLEAKVSQLQTKLDQSTAVVNGLLSTKTRCVDLETQLAATIDDNDRLVAELHEQLRQNAVDFEAMQSKLKAADAFGVMEQRLNTMSDEVAKSHRRAEALSAEIAEKHDKIRGKNQIIQKLETELSERIATFDQMAKVFELKGVEYKSVCETLSTTEKHLQRLSEQMSAVQPVLSEVFGRLFPHREFDFSNVETWNSIGEHLLQLESTVGALSAKLSATCSERDELSQQLSVQKCELMQRAQSVERLESRLAACQLAIDDDRVKFTRTLRALEDLKLEKQLLEKSSLENETASSAEISNLQKLLVEAETRTSALCAQRNGELADLIDKVHTLGRENEQQRNHFKAQVEIHEAKFAELLNEFKRSEESARSIRQENVRLQSDLTKALSDFDAMKADRDQRRCELDELAKRLVVKQSDMSRFEAKLHTLKERYADKLHTLQKSLSNCEADKWSLGNTVSQLEETLAQCQQERADASCKVDQLTTQVIGLENREHELESSLKDKCESLEAIRHEMDLLEQRTRETCSQYDETEHKLTEREAEVARLIDDVANAKTELSERHEDVNSYHDHVKALAEEKVRYEHEIKALRTQISSNSDEYQAEALEMQQELSIMTERYNIKCHECETLTQDIRSKAGDIERFDKQIASLEAQNQKLNCCRAQLRQQLEQELKLKDRSSITARQLEQEIDELKGTVKSSSEQVAVLNVAVSRYEAELGELREALEERDTTQRVLQNQIDDWRQKFEQKSDALSTIEKRSTEANEQLSSRNDHFQKRIDQLVEMNEVNCRSLNDDLDKLKLKQAQMELSELKQTQDSDRVRQLLSDRETLCTELQTKLDHVSVELEAKTAACSNLETLSESSCNALKVEQLSSRSLHDAQQQQMKHQDDLNENCAELNRCFAEQRTNVERSEMSDTRLLERHFTDSSRRLLDSDPIPIIATVPVDQLQTTASDGSEQQLNAEVADSCSKLHQASIRSSVEVTPAFTTPMKTFHRQSAEQQQLLTLSAKTQQAEQVDDLRKQLEQSESAQFVLKTQLESSQLELNARTLELSELLMSSDLSRNHLTRELEIARQELSQTSEKSAEINSRLQTKLDSLRKQLTTNQQLTMSQLGGGVLKIQDELNSHLTELSELRQLVVDQKHELSSVLVALTEQLCVTTARLHSTKLGCSHDRSLVDRCLDALRQRHVQSLSWRRISNGGRRREPEFVDAFDVHFQTFNGPTAQFVAEQQASSTELMKRLAAAMERDDTAPHHQKQLHLGNGDTATTIKVDPFDTIKQQRILIHELMAKLETTKKVLDEEVSRRKELDDHFKAWSVDQKLHNAQVSFNIAQLSTRDDTFDSAPIMDSRKQLIPEKSLHVTRQFPTYVDSFIRWLVSSAPPRSATLPQN